MFNMTVLINPKICDNSKDCSGIQVCPVKAFYWDESNKTIAVDDTKCTNCGKCEEACPVGAIKVARTDEEYTKTKKEIDEDLRKVSDLFVDRYGAEPQSPAFKIPKDKFKIQILESTQPAVVELFTGSSIKCLLHSIPIKELFEDMNVKYRKIEVEQKDSLLEDYEIKELPSMLFFKDGKLLGKIEGYFDYMKKLELEKEIDKILQSFN